MTKNTAKMSYHISKVAMPGNRSRLNLILFSNHATSHDKYVCSRGCVISVRECSVICYCRYAPIAQEITKDDVHMSKRRNQICMWLISIGKSTGFLDRLGLKRPEGPKCEQGREARRAELQLKKD